MIPRRIHQNGGKGNSLHSGNGWMGGRHVENVSQAMTGASLGLVSNTLVFIVFICIILNIICRTSFSYSCSFASWLHLTTVYLPPQGMPGTIAGVDVDTSYFTGNYAPRVSLQAATLTRPGNSFLIVSFNFPFSFPFLTTLSKIFLFIVHHNHSYTLFTTLVSSIPSFHMIIPFLDTSLYSMIKRLQHTVHKFM